MMRAPVRFSKSASTLSEMGAEPEKQSSKLRRSYLSMPSKWLIALNIAGTAGNRFTRCWRFAHQRGDVPGIGHQNLGHAHAAGKPHAHGQTKDVEHGQGGHHDLVPFSNPRNQACICWMLQERFRWLRVAPFDRPVVPPCIAKAQRRRTGPGVWPPGAGSFSASPCNRAQWAPCALWRSARDFGARA